jgi:tetratricopeptide (TPR) repeat protein
LEVTSLPPINPTEFIAVVKPLLEGRDVQGLKGLLRSRWTHAQIATLFQCDNPDVRKTAALAFSLVGKKCCLPKLAPLLKDPDPVVNQMAEHAMWSVWFACGSPEAKHELCRGSKALNCRDHERAIEAFSRAIELDPGFAEAYNQRAIVKYLQERYDESIRDCQATVERMPCHFGAWAGMGHCHAHQGRAAEAIEAYETALSINPHIEGVRQAIDDLRATLNHRT